MLVNRNNSIVVIVHDDQNYFIRGYTLWEKDPFVSSIDIQQELLYLSFGFILEDYLLVNAVDQSIVKLAYETCVFIVLAALEEPHILR